MNRSDLSETDIRTKYITPALVDAGWDLHKQIREEKYFTDGRIRVRGSVAAREKRNIKRVIVTLLILEEQHRIVWRIEELFAICDRFKAQLEQRKKVNERLVKVLVGEVLEGV